MAFDAVTYALCKNTIKLSLDGLGVIKGSPCTIKSIVPTYSTVDPTVIVGNTVTFEWTSNSGATTQSSYFTVDEGRGIYNVEWNYSTTSFHYYTITFYDGSTDELQIPVSSGQLKKKIVNNIPDPATADDSTFYLVPIAGKVGSYSQYIRVETNSGNFEMLFIGTTDMDLIEYQKKIDNNIIKDTYKNYDDNTRFEKPTAPNVVGAINEHELVIGTGAYDYVNGEIPALNTYHKTSLVDAINEIGNLSDLEFWDDTTQTPATIVDAINLANADYEIVENTTIDRTKNIDTYKLTKDAGDGSPITQQGDTVEIPRVDVVQKSVADTGDYKTYDIKVGGELSDPNDTSNTAYGSIHIPKIRIVKDTNPPDSTLSSQYWLEIEGEAGYNADRCGVKIDIAKDSFIKDIVIQTVTTINLPYVGALVGEKYLEFIFTLADGTDKSVYLPVKDMLKAYEGKEAIFLDETTSNTTTYIKLIINDPDNIQALTQDVNGLLIKKATSIQYGVVEFATQAEVLNPSDSTEKVVKPYDLYDFVNNSTSVRDDLQNLYKRDVVDINGVVTPTTVNGTVIKAINEIASIEIDKLDVPESGDYATYQLETHPASNTINILGDKIHLTKSIVAVQSLTNLTIDGQTATPNDYTLYHLTQLDDDGVNYYTEGLYIYENATWVKVAGDEAIIEVEELPTDNIIETSFYNVVNKDTVVDRYTMTQDALDRGYSVHEDGVHYETTINSWAAVLLDWADWLGDELIKSDSGEVYLVTHSDGTQELIYDYDVPDSAIYYYTDDEWIRVSPPDRITFDMISELDIED